MNSRLTNTDRDRLIKVLGLLESNHDGERAAAGFMAAQMLRDRGLDWNDLISPAEPPALRQPVTVRSMRVPTYPASSWIAQIQFLRRHAARLNAWETEFLRSAVARTRLTTRQGEILFEIQDRLLGEGVR